MRVFEEGFLRKMALLREKNILLYANYKNATQSAQLHTLISALAIRVFKCIAYKLEPC